MYTEYHHHDHKLKYMNTWLYSTIHVHVGIAFPRAQRAGCLQRRRRKIFEILDLSEGKIDVFDAGRAAMHAQTNPLQRVYDCVRCACANSRTRHTKTRLEATLPFRTLEMQLQFSLHAGLFTSGGMLPSAKAHAYARPILLKYMH